MAVVSWWEWLFGPVRENTPVAIPQTFIQELLNRVDVVAPT